MLLTPYIEKSQRTLKTSDLVSVVLQQLEKYPALPLLQDGKYLGVIRYSDLENLSIDENQEVEIYSSIIYRPILMENKTPVEAIHLLSKLETPFLPIVDMENNYLGVWNDESTLKYYKNSENFSDDSAAVILEIEPRNYSLSELAQITESANKTLIGVQVHPMSENDTLMVSLYIRDKDIGDVIDALERYGYRIIDTLGYANKHDTLRDNYDALMSYLNI